MNIKKFKVLDRGLSLHQNYLLEASAGTGKTFSIQNIVVRLLIEPRGEEETLPLHKILIVTFTRAATRDLKIRIRSNIEEALRHLQDWQSSNLIDEKTADYLKALMEQGKEVVQYACKRLQQALFTFDQAQIFTIHSFCARMLKQFALESDIGLHSLADDEPLTQSEILGVIHDFFRTEVRMERYSVAQLEILLKLDPRQKKLLRLIQSGYHFPIYPSFLEICQQLNERRSFLKKEFSLTSEKMLEDFTLQAKVYRNYKGDETKAKTLAKVSRFVKLFDGEEWSCEDVDGLISDGLVWVKALDPDLLKGKAPSEKELHYPGLTDRLEKDLLPILERGANPAILLSRMAGDCKKLLQRYQMEEEKLSHDDVLRKMGEALDHPSFLIKVQDSYRAAIIDEFQDTDPLQWKIFKNLFASKEFLWKGNLYLVGDPKQSIYSFRQADIYTYLAAAQTLGEERCFSLDVNYRSQQCLVQALNTLFSAEHLNHFIPLPRESIYLPYQPVEAGNPSPPQLLGEGRGAIHFFLADSQKFEKPKLSDLEAHIFFPFIAQEILSLRKQHSLDFSQFAILVRDRHQSIRLAEYLEEMGIPFLNQRGTSLTASPAHQSLSDLIRAIHHPHDRSAARAVLGSPLMGWSQDEIQEEGAMEFAFLFIRRVKGFLLEKGFASCFQEMLHMRSKPSGEKILEQILAREEGVEFYRDLQQLADLITEHQYIDWNTSEGIIPFLDNLHTWEENEDARMKRFQDPTKEGVKILTLHFSKGLEFDVVFALGVVNRTSTNDELIPVEREGRQILSPKNEDREGDAQYCEECDAEKMRQLYVALTRAKKTLYIPAALHFPSEKLSPGEASPIDLFLASLWQEPSCSYKELYSRIKGFTGASLLEFLERVGKDNFISFSIHQEILKGLSYKAEVKPSPILYPPSQVVVSGAPLWITSFSTLSQQAHLKSSKRLTSPLILPHDYDCLDKNIHTLPANNETGLLIHEILEKIAFASFNSFKDPEEALPLIRPFTQGTPFQKWDLIIAQLIFNTLKTPLMNDGNGFSLSTLIRTQMYREMPFIFSYREGDVIEDVKFDGGLIKGVIDCIFVHKERYYLADWKSNWLGSKIEDYSQENIALAMEENRYFLQASIYKEAFRRYLALVDQRPFEECFGGTFYLFMRGISLDHGSGVFFLDLNSSSPSPTQRIERL